MSDTDDKGDVFFVSTEGMKLRYEPGEQIDLMGLRAFVNDRDVTDECYVSAGHRFWPENAKSLRVRVRWEDLTSEVVLRRKASLFWWVFTLLVFTVIILVIYLTSPLWPHSFQM